MRLAMQGCRLFINYLSKEKVGDKFMVLDAVRGARSAEAEIVWGYTARLRAPRNAAMCLKP